MNVSNEKTAGSSMSAPTTPYRRRMGLRYVGIAAFAFFLFKGLLWLAVPGFLLLWRWLAA